MLKAIAAASLALLVLASSVGAVPGPAQNDCEHYVHQSVIAIALQIAAGDNEIHADNGNCMRPLTTSSLLIWGANYSGPVIAGAATATWVASGFSGCSMGAITVVGALGLNSASSAANSIITMTSAQCRGLVTFTLTIPLVYTYTVYLPINIVVEPTTLNVVNSGELDIHQDQACGAAAGTPCHLRHQNFTADVDIGNQTVAIPSSFEVTNTTGDFFAPILLWIVGIWASMRLAKLMAAGACTIGLGFSLVAPGNLPLQILALAILGVVLWLEAFARERIYAHFFKPLNPNGTLDRE
jgi:hypothetical protein